MRRAAPAVEQLEKGDRAMEQSPFISQLTKLISAILGPDSARC